MTDQESEAPGPEKKSPFWTRKVGQTDEEDEGEEETEEEEDEGEVEGEGEEGDEEARVNDPKKNTQ